MADFDSSVTIIYNGPCLRPLSPDCGGDMAPEGNEFTFRFEARIPGATEYRLTVSTTAGANYGFQGLPADVDGDGFYTLNRTLQVQVGEELLWIVTAWNEAGAQLAQSDDCTFTVAPPVTIGCSNIIGDLGVGEKKCYALADFASANALIAEIRTTPDRVDARWDSVNKRLCFTGLAAGSAYGSYRVSDTQGHHSDCGYQFSIKDYGIGCRDDVFCTQWDEALELPLAANDYNPDNLELKVWPGTASGPGRFEWDGETLFWRPDFKAATSAVASVEYGYRQNGVEIGCRCIARVVLTPPPNTSAFSLCNAELRAGVCEESLQTVARVRSVSMPRTFQNIGWQSPMTGLSYSNPNGYAPTSQMSFEIIEAGPLDPSHWALTSGQVLHVELLFRHRESETVSVLKGQYTMESFSPSYTARGKKIPASVSMKQSGALERNYIF